jgi:hypothetical protein
MMSVGHAALRVASDFPKRMLLNGSDRRRKLLVVMLPLLGSASDRYQQIFQMAIRNLRGRLPAHLPISIKFIVLDV